MLSCCLHLHPAAPPGATPPGRALADAQHRQVNPPPPPPRSCRVASYKSPPVTRRLLSGSLVGSATIYFIFYDRHGCQKIFGAKYHKERNRSPLRRRFGDQTGRTHQMNILKFISTPPYGSRVLTATFRWLYLIYSIEMMSFFLLLPSIHFND